MLSSVRKVVQSRCYQKDRSENLWGYKSREGVQEAEDGCQALSKEKVMSSRWA